MMLVIHTYAVLLPAKVAVGDQPGFTMAATIASCKARSAVR